MVSPIEYILPTCYQSASSALVLLARVLCTLEQLTARYLVTPPLFSLSLYLTLLLNLPPRSFSTEGSNTFV